MRHIRLLSVFGVCALTQFSVIAFAQEGKTAAAVPTAVPQFGCSATVSYQVQRSGATTPTEVTFAIVEAHGPSEAEAKQSLAAALIDTQSKARKRCVDQHESIGSCISGQLVTRGSLLSTLDFSARKLVEESIKKECDAKAGICGEVKAGESQCIAPPPPPVDAAAEKGKGDKKKK